MGKLISKPKANLNSSAPRISTIKIDKNKIKDIIGPSGKNIKELCDRTGAKIDIEDDGNVTIFSLDESSLKDTLNTIQGIVAVPEVGKVYRAKITKIVQFGAFANF